MVRRVELGRVLKARLYKLDRSRRRAEARAGGTAGAIILQYSSCRNCCSLLPPTRVNHGHSVRQGNPHVGLPRQELENELTESRKEIPRQRVELIQCCTSLDRVPLNICRAMHACSIIIGAVQTPPISLSNQCRVKHVDGRPQTVLKIRFLLRSNTLPTWDVQDMAPEERTLPSWLTRFEQ